jgi:hypothetical protein
MAKFQFQNYQDEDVELVIEPWAMSKVVPAAGIIEFEVNDLPPPEMEFCITEKGSALYLCYVRTGANSFRGQGSRVYESISTSDRGISGYAKAPLVITG